MPPLSPDEADLTHYPGSLLKTLMFMEPEGLCAVLIMIAALLFAIFRTFSATGNTLLTALPLAAGLAIAAQQSVELIPYIDKAVHQIGDLDLDTGIMLSLAQIRLILILGVGFSLAVACAILLRHSRKEAKAVRERALNP